jgi:hypothetical protein
MSSTEKRASLSSGLLIPKDIARIGDAEPVPEDGPEEEGGDSEDTAALAPPAVLPATMLSRKGAASAAGFRPEYWAYDRAVTAAPPAESPAVVPLFSDQPPRQADPPTRSEPTAALEIPVPAAMAAPKAQQTRPSVLILGLGCIAIILSLSLYWLSGAGRGDRTVSLTPVSVIAVPPAAPAPPVQVAPATEVASARPEIPVAVAPQTPPPVDSQDTAPPHVEAQPADAPAAVAESSTAPVAAAPPEAPAASLSPDEIESLIVRGDQLLATGDIVAARLFFQRAAEQGSGPAATEVGKTFDPLFLEQAHVRGIRGDAAAAADWYRKAAAAGDHQGQTRLDRLLARFPG